MREEDYKAIVEIADIRLRGSPDKWELVTFRWMRDAYTEKWEREHPQPVSWEEMERIVGPIPIWAVGIDGWWYDSEGCWVLVNSGDVINGKREVDFDDGYVIDFDAEGVRFYRHQLKGDK